MTKNKTALIIIAIVILLSITMYFLPINKIVGNIPFVKTFYNNTSLEIISQNGKASVNINGKAYGETPLTIEDLAEGEYTIEMTRISDENTFYTTQSIDIELVRNTSARIDIELGPNSVLHGTVLYYTKAPRSSGNDGLLTVTSSVNEAKVYIDGEYLKKTPVSGLKLTDNQYQMRVTAEGYEEVEIPIFIRDGYHLNLKTYQFPIPVIFDNVDQVDE